MTVDIDASRSALATEHLQEAGLDGFVDLRVADAGEMLRLQADASLDVILLDAERDQYVGYWPDLCRALRPGGLLVVDNVLSHPTEVRDFRARVAAATGVTDAVLPVGAGLLLIVMR